MKAHAAHQGRYSRSNVYMKYKYLQRSPLLGVYDSVDMVLMQQTALLVELLCGHCLRGIVCGLPGNEAAKTRAAVQLRRQLGPVRGPILPCAACTIERGEGRR